MKIAEEIDRIIRMDDLSVSIEQKKMLILGEIAVALAGLLEVKLAEADFHKLRDVQPQRWIPVSEALPEEDKDVLISYRYKEGEGDTSYTYIDITSYGEIGGNHKNWRSSLRFFEPPYEVIAWMSLPEPWRGRRV